MFGWRLPRLLKMRLMRPGPFKEAARASWTTPRDGNESNCQFHQGSGLLHSILLIGSGPSTSQST